MRLPVPENVHSSPVLVLVDLAPREAISEFDQLGVAPFGGNDLSGGSTLTSLLRS